MAEDGRGLLEAVAAASSQCQELRASYDVCFLSWYRSSFLAGDLKHDSCSKIWEDYRTCVLKELKGRGWEKIAQFEYNMASDCDASTQRPRRSW
ncbi:unnamed protein product [Durusdinium trenchii]|uniref:Uncharacterized protein n=1 Tax=Durusdinium trenchii TaxID=1381693 RepID=A0ABP0MFF9_9DINO